MAYCTRCGARIADDDSYCTRCGAEASQATRRMPPPVFGPESPVSPVPPAPPVPPGPPRPGRGRRVGAVAGVVVLVAAAVGVTLVVTRSGTSKTPVAHPSAAASPSAVAPVSFAQLFKSVNSGVVRISATTCDGGGIGTGFLLSPTLVATAAHVVNDAAVIGLSSGSQTTTGTVVGIDTQSDVALVRADRALSGHVFTLAGSRPEVGATVAAIGFPEGDPITFTTGTVSGLDRTETIEGTQRSGLLQTDAALNPGNSGGPLIDQSERVVGVVDAKNTQAEGIGLAVESTVAKPLLEQWSRTPQVVPAAQCSAPVGPSGGPSPDLSGGTSGSPAEQGIAATLAQFFDGINSADYASAYAAYTAEQQAQNPYDGFVSGEQSSYDIGVSLVSVTPSGPDTAVAYVTFTSLQNSSQGPDGDTCDDWTIDYSMRDVGGTWLIDGAQGHDGGPTHSTC